jgi:hypothetical protein
MGDRACLGLFGRAIGTSCGLPDVPTGIDPGIRGSSSGRIAAAKPGPVAGLMRQNKFQETLENFL